MARLGGLTQRIKASLVFDDDLYWLECLPVSYLVRQMYTTATDTQTLTIECLFSLI